MFRARSKTSRKRSRPMRYSSRRFVSGPSCGRRPTWRARPRTTPRRSRRPPRPGRVVPPAKPPSPASVEQNRRSILFRSFRIMRAMIPPGLLPESSEPPRSSSSWVLAAVVLTALLALLGALLQIRRLARERDDAVEKLAAVQKKRPVETPPRGEEPAPSAEPAPAPGAPVPPPPPAAPPRAPDVRVLPSRTPDPQHIAQGLHEFRAGRFDQAERQFFRAFPDSLLYLALTSLAQARYSEAL